MKHNNIINSFLLEIEENKHISVTSNKFDLFLISTFQNIEQNTDEISKLIFYSQTNKDFINIISKEDNIISLFKALKLGDFNKIEFLKLINVEILEVLSKYDYQIKNFLEGKNFLSSFMDNNKNMFSNFCLKLFGNTISKYKEDAEHNLKTIDKVSSNEIEEILFKIKQTNAFKEFFNISRTKKDKAKILKQG